MKYLKKFESIDKSKCFWKVKTKYPDLEASLYKLDVPDNLIQMYLRNDTLRISGKYVYIAPFYAKDYASWNEFDKQGKRDYEEMLIYQGEIEITDKDIEDMEMKKSVKKYNL